MAMSVIITIWYATLLQEQYDMPLCFPRNKLDCGSPHNPNFKVAPQFGGRLSHPSRPRVASRDPISLLLVVIPSIRLPKYWKVTQGMVSFTSSGVEAPSCACLSTRTVAPIKKDTQNFVSILDNFEEVTVLHTNFLKSSVVKSLI
jgi:hypothetical protein